VFGPDLTDSKSSPSLFSVTQSLRYITVSCTPYSNVLSFGYPCPNYWLQTSICISSFPIKTLLTIYISEVPEFRFNCVHTSCLLKIFGFTCYPWNITVLQFTSIVVIICVKTILQFDLLTACKRRSPQSSLDNFQIFAFLQMGKQQ